MANGKKTGPRVIALVGPYLSGKTTLLENILFFTKTTRRRANGERVFGDDSIEAKALSMGVDINLASADYLGDEYIFIDCPGSIEFAQEARNAIFAADVAIVVAEPEPVKIQALSPLLHDLERMGIPHILFINKIDHSEIHIRELAAAIDEVSAVPAILRHVPIREDGTITGFVDLAATRAYHYEVGGASTRIDMPEALADQVASDRFEMMERLADFHDELMEELLEDIDPPADEVFGDLAVDLQQGCIMPVMMGCAGQMFGVRRLMKALRHEVCGMAQAAERLNPTEQNAPSLYILKTRHLPHMGKLSIARVTSGMVQDGSEISGGKLPGLFAVTGTDLKKTSKAHAGDIVVVPRLDGVGTGEMLGGEALELPTKLEPVYAMAVEVHDRKDEAKLSDALTKLMEEDPSYELVHCVDTGQFQLWGQGEIHLRAAKIRLADKYGVNVSFVETVIPYKETIRRTTTQHTRYKKQSGGHGQFGDVVLEVKPRPIGSGFDFTDKVTGGTIPKQYIPSVEAGVKEYMQRGPLGFPVVDVSVTLQDGKHHAVDSSDMAFKTAGRKAMAEALPECEPVLLEPIEEVHVLAPSSYIAKVNGMITSRRGQILGFDVRDGWPGWDRVDAQIPSSEIKDMILELRSLTQGTGTFSHKFDHLTEVAGRMKEQVLKGRGEQQH
jgi:elongation factor G